MRIASTLFLFSALSGGLAAAAYSAAKKAPVQPPADDPLILIGKIVMPNVEGRLDHFAIDFKGRLFDSAYGNNSEEVISLAREAVSATIPVPVPQGVVYSPASNELFVASDAGELHIFEGTSFRPIKTISFGDDVDDLRYDASDHRVYLGFGDGAAGAITAVDATTNREIGGIFKLGAHPEAFELEKNGPDIFVNLPTLHQIAVINRRTRTITRWHLTLGGNFPMALDEADHRLFAATHDPPRLAVYDTDSGRLIAALPCVANEDDMYFDAARKRIYITGGQGFISVFQQEDPDHYRLLANIRSGLGARTSGYWGPLEKDFDRFYVGVPAPVCGPHCAEILIYTVQN
jgi:DNA-binding beta-propeller fold protein YncE